VKTYGGELNIPYLSRQQIRISLKNRRIFIGDRRHSGAKKARRHVLSTPVSLKFFFERPENHETALTIDL
jgi:hypothetical protein